MKSTQFISYLLLLLGIALILLLIQYGIVYRITDDFTFFYPVWSIYLFHFLITGGIFSLLYVIGKYAPKYIGFSFMALILFKMTAAIVFLLPLIKLKDVSKIPDFISFFAPYFIFLLLEILLTMKILKLSEENFSTNSFIEKNNTG